MADNNPKNSADEKKSVAEQAEQMLDRGGKQKALNRMITICWAVIVLFFTGSYIIEVVKGVRDLDYLITFLASMLVPLAVCFVHYMYHPDDPHYGTWVICGYFVMYTYAILTGETTMVFSYILPMLSFMVLLHRPLLVAVSGIAALIVNILSVVNRYYAGQITLEDSRDVEIQLALIIFCFTGAWLSSRMYLRITKSNEEALQQLLAQQNQINGLETVVLVDKLTGLGNRAAYDKSLNEIEENGKMVGAIFCDANGLKYRNDHMGHQAGDQLLCDIADRLREHFRPQDCFRISGDEFVVLIPNLDSEVFNIRAGRFRDDIWSDEIPLTGVGWDHSENSAQEAVKNAEIRMYADKEMFYQKYPKYRRL